MGVDMIAGPAFNFGYGGATFGRGAGFFNVRPDGMAAPPNPSLRFMTANVERMIVTNTGDIGIGTSTPGGRFQIFAAPTADVFAGIGTDMTAGPSMNLGYGGATFGRGAGFINARPDASAVTPNPSLRFMTINQERMIITNAGNVGIGTSSPSQKLDVAGTVNVAGDLILPATSSASTGVIKLGAFPFIHNFGTFNAFLGQAGNFLMTGAYNVGVGAAAFQNNTSGAYNTAIGSIAFLNNTTGSNNTGIGSSALDSNTSGSNNTAVGAAALSANSGGNYNTGVGLQALYHSDSASFNTAVGFNALFTNTGSSNIGIGADAGLNLTTGNSNIDIGNSGVAAESSTIRIGTSASQTRAFIAGIRGKTTDTADAIAVLIDSNGQLGTVSSSRRYKFDIADMSDATDALMRLRPVTFRYQQYGDHGRIQYGLIAEDVAEVYPELVARNQDGEPETVMYQFLAPMLLNEVQKQHALLQNERAENAALRARIEQIEKVLQSLKAEK